MKRAFLLLLGWVGLLACRQVATVPLPLSPTPSATPEIGVTLVTRVRPTTAVRPLSTSTPQPSATVTPTATPIVYQIEAGDTLLDLALRYGYTVADIEALNPGIRPELLQVGQAVVLPPPPTAVSQQVLATLVPLQLVVGQVQQYRTPGGAVWVLGELVNEGSVAVEAVRVGLAFVDGTGEVVVETAVWVAATIIPPGATAPFAALLAGVPLAVEPVVSIVAGQSVVDLGSRYLGVEATAVSLASSEAQVTLTGSLINTGEATAVGLRLVATFYDAAGRLSGFQVLELGDERLAVGEKRPFSLIAAPPGGEVVAYGLLVQGGRE